jgi:hypothetical protein
MGITVAYSVSGTASNGADYTLLTRTVPLPAGATNADIVIAPWNDLVSEGDETVVIALQSGPYIVTPPGTATVTIVDTALTAYYVSANGSQTAPYDTWAKAFTNLQDALDYPGAKVSAAIYLAGQTISHPAGGVETASVFLWQSATNVNLLGGYRADPGLDNPGPGTRNSALYPTILRRLSGERRVLRISAVSNGVIEQVTIRDGYTASWGSGVSGLGVYLGSCRDVTFADCIISNNVSTIGGSYGGGGLYLAGSTVVLTNTTLANNQLRSSNWDPGFMGGGIRVDGASRLTAAPL